MSSIRALLPESETPGDLCQPVLSVRSVQGLADRLRDRPERTTERLATLDSAIESGAVTGDLDQGAASAHD